jgi:hypothetical protein
MWEIDDGGTYALTVDDKETSYDWIFNGDDQNCNFQVFAYWQ